MEKKKVKRKRKQHMPPPIHDTPENVARALFPVQDVAPRARSESAKEKGVRDRADSG